MIYGLELEFVVFYLRSDYDLMDPKHFFRPPQPGMIAWCQYRHVIDLHNSYFLSSNWAALAKHVGLKFCPAHEMFKKSSWNPSSKL